MIKIGETYVPYFDCITDCEGEADPIIIHVRFSHQTENTYFFIDKNSRHFSLVEIETWKDPEDFIPPENSNECLIAIFDLKKISVRPRFNEYEASCICWLYNITKRQPMFRLDHVKGWFNDYIIKPTKR